MGANRRRRGDDPRRVVLEYCDLKNVHAVGVHRETTRWPAGARLVASAVRGSLNTWLVARLVGYQIKEGEDLTVRTRTVTKAMSVLYKNPRVEGGWMTSLSVCLYSLPSYFSDASPSSFVHSLTA